MDLVKHDLFQDLAKTQCADPFGCLGRHQDPVTQQQTLYVWQPEAESVLVLAIDQDKTLMQMTPSVGSLPPLGLRTLVTYIID